MVRSLRLSTVTFAAVTLAMAVGNHVSAQRLSGLLNRQPTTTQLLARDQVQSELKLNAEQKNQIQEITNQLNSNVRARSRAARERGLSREERRTKQAKVAEETAGLRAAAQAQIDALLDDAQRTRLGQVTLWVRGVSALADDDLARQLELTEAQRTQITETGGIRRRGLASAFRELRDGTLRASDLRERMSQLSREADKQRLAVLSKDQQAAYAALKGTEFKLTATASTRRRTARPRAARTATQRRIQKRSYEFKEAGKEMEYALFVPASYSATQEYPLIVALHGLGSNPQQIMHYRGLTDLAEEHRYIVVAPMGYNERGWYGSRGQSSSRSRPNNLGELSEQDVMNVLALARKEFNIADNRIYLMGHSMGGGGTWHLGIKHPDIWAALAPIAPAIRGNTSNLEKIKHIPVIVVQGDQDPLVPVRGARRWVAKMKELGMEHSYIEVAGGDHTSIAFEKMPDIFAFFNQHPARGQPPGGVDPK